MAINILNGLNWMLAAFFIIGGVVNGIAPKKVQDDYSRWGYPGWFHYVTAASELMTAMLLISPETRVMGSILGVAVMLGALATLLRHSEYTHAVPPAIVLILTAVCGWFAFNA